MKILAQRPTHISAVATMLLITKTFTVKYYYRRIQTNRETETETEREVVGWGGVGVGGLQTERKRHRHTERDLLIHSKNTVIKARH